MPMQASRNIWPLFWSTLILFTLLSTASLHAAADGSGKPFIVIETAVIHKDNSSAARERAIARSLQTAVRQEACRMMEEDDLTYHFKSVNEIVAGPVERFIETYRVLSESADGDRYGVLVAVSVATESLQQALTAGGVRLDSAGLPTVLVMVTETLPDDTSPRFGWGQGMSAMRIYSEEGVSAHLRAMGYSVLSARDLDLAHLQQTPYPDGPDLFEVARGAGAEVIVVGRSDAAILPNQMGSDIKSFRGESRLRAYRRDEPAPFTEALRDAVTTDADVYSGSISALTAAGRASAEEIARQIASVWRRDQTSKKMLTLTVEGTSYLSSFVRFRRALREMPGVKRLQVSAMKSNRATLEVDYAGSPRELADALMLQAFESFGLMIHEVQPDGLTLGLMTGQQAPADTATSGETDTP
jgi:hypothetical protein